MTRPRLSTTRELYGIIGKIPDSGKFQSKWNRHFDKEGMDAFIDKYPTTVEQLPERLSEMFHFDRRAYIVGKELQVAIIPLLDEVDDAVKDRVEVVINRGGIMKGYAEMEAFELTLF
jgi:shikimate 5-dehydrogenase